MPVWSTLGRALRQRLGLAGMICCLAGAAGADGLTRYKCRIAFDDQSRGNFSETMTITVLNPAWSVLVEDDLTDMALGQAVEAKVQEKSSNRISFGWNLPLKKKGVGGSANTVFRMTILTDRNEASLTSTWSGGWKRFHATAAGNCRKAKG